MGRVTPTTNVLNAEATDESIAAEVLKIPCRIKSALSTLVGNPATLNAHFRTNRYEK
jgi:hypothetical protein